MKNIKGYVDEWEKKLYWGKDICLAIQWIMCGWRDPESAKAWATHEIIWKFTRQNADTKLRKHYVA